MSKNKIIFLSVLVGTFIAIMLFNSRSLGLCNIYCGSAIGKYQDIFLIFPIILLFSVATLFTREAVFQAWWSFARVAIPAILLISFVISLELHHSPGGWFNTDNEVDIVMTAGMYVLFILGSVWQMYRGFREKE